MLELCKSLLCRLVKMPTSFHLWCAERELGAVRASNPDLQPARDQNLERLRTYRLQGEFPENTHDATQLEPCFVDEAGRQCAVAFLMDQSGAKDAVKKIAAEANDARIGEMRVPELDSWASESGLTKSELARIQPRYAPTPEDVVQCAVIVFPMWIIVGMAANSILFNVGRLVWAFKPRLTTISAGIVLGIVLLNLAISVKIGDLGIRPRLLGYIVITQAVAIGIGVCSIICALAALCIRRGKWRPTKLEEDIEKPKNDIAIPPSERVKDLKHGFYQ